MHNDNNLFSLQFETTCTVCQSLSEPFFVHLVTITSNLYFLVTQGSEFNLSLKYYNPTLSLKDPKFPYLFILYFLFFLI